MKWARAFPLDRQFVCIVYLYSYLCLLHVIVYDMTVLLFINLLFKHMVLMFVIFTPLLSFFYVPRSSHLLFIFDFSFFFFVVSGIVCRSTIHITLLLTHVFEFCIFLVLTHRFYASTRFNQIAIIERARMKSEEGDFLSDMITIDGMIFNFRFKIDSINLRALDRWQIFSFFFCSSFGSLFVSVHVFDVTDFKAREECESDQDKWQSGHLSCIARRWHQFSCLFDCFRLPECKKFHSSC